MYVKTIFIVTSLFCFSLSRAQGEKAYSVGVGFSNLGYTLQLALQKAEKSSYRISVGTFQKSLKDITYVLDNRDFILNSDLTFGGSAFLYDWYLTKSRFKFVLGVGYSMAKIQGSLMLKDSLKLGEIGFNQSDVGRANFEVSPLRIMPYFGIGIGNATPKNRMNVQFEIGTYYILDRNVSFNCTGLIAPTSDQKELIVNNLKEYQWFPNASVIVSYKIK